MVMMMQVILEVMIPTHSLEFKSLSESVRC